MAPGRRTPPVNNVGEPCAGEPHARIDAAAGGNQPVGTAAQPGASRRPDLDLGDGLERGLTNDEKAELTQLRGRPVDRHETRFVEGEKAQHPVCLLCRTLGLSRAGYDAAAQRPISAHALKDEQLARQVEAIWRASRETYPRIQGELARQRVSIARTRVAR